MDQQLFDLDQPVSQLLQSPLALVGPLLPLINHSSNPVNQLVDRLVDKIASRPVRQRKRIQVAIEAKDEPVMQPRCKRRKRTGWILRVSFSSKEVLSLHANH